MHRRIYFAEAAEVHRRTYGAPCAGYGPKMAELLAEGFATRWAGYQGALQHQVGFRHTMARLLADVDAYVTPATPGPAPASRATTGDPKNNAPGSHAGTPTISIPFARTSSGFPIALQLVGKAWSEPQLPGVVPRGAKSDWDLRRRRMALVGDFALFRPPPPVAGLARVQTRFASLG